MLFDVLCADDMVVPDQLIQYFWVILDLLTCMLPGASANAVRVADANKSRDELYAIIVKWIKVYQALNGFPDAYKVAQLKVLNQLVGAMMSGRSDIPYESYRDRLIKTR